MKSIKQLKKGIVFEIEIVPEEIPIEGNASAIDPETDKKIADEIHFQLERGNDWAWCSVRVQATHPDYPNAVGNDFLSCCSYKNQKDFESDGYYEDMKNQAAEELLKTIKGIECRRLYQAISDTLTLGQFQDCMFKDYLQFALMSKKVSRSKKIHALADRLLKTCVKVV